MNQIVKNLLIFSLIGFCYWFGQVHGYPEPGQSLWRSLHQNNLIKPQIQACGFEQREDGSKSNIVQINGILPFNKFVVERSQQCPVVVKIFTEQNLDSVKVKSVYQAVADRFLGKVFFVSIDLFQVPENKNILTELMLRENITKLDLPLFLFFKGGKLFRPASFPVAVLQGFYTKENLEQFIKQKFFSEDSQQSIELSQGNGQVQDREGFEISPSGQTIQKKQAACKRKGIKMQEKGPVLGKTLTDFTMTGTPAHR